MYCLITGATLAKAFQLRKQLQNQHILLGDYLDLPEVMVRAGQMIRLPSPFQPSYAHQMLTLCLDSQIGQVYALHGAEVDLLKEAEQLFSEYDIQLFYHADNV